MGKNRRGDRETCDDHLYARYETVLAQKARLVARLAKLGARHAALSRTRQSRLPDSECTSADDTGPGDSSGPFCGFTSAKDETDILALLGVVPSNDIAERKRLAGMFMPHTQILLSELRCDCGGDGHSGHGLNDRCKRVFRLTIVLPNLFEQALGLVYDRETNGLDHIYVASDVAQMVNLHLLSRSYYDAITANYTAARKLDLIVYGLGQLAEALHRRIKVFHILIEKYSVILMDRNMARRFANDGTPAKETRLLTELRLVHTLDFGVTYGGESQRVSLKWEVGVELARANSVATVTLVAHQARTKQMANLDRLFQLLVAPYGELGAVDVIFRRLFGVGKGVE